MAQNSNEFKSSAVSIRGKTACYAYSFEEFPDAFDLHPFAIRASAFGTGITFSFYGRLDLGLFTFEKLLLPNTKTPIIAATKIN